jgi:hypothetical protein
MTDQEQVLRNDMESFIQKNFGGRITRPLS